MKFGKGWTRNPAGTGGAEPVHCSFCGKSQRDVRKIVAAATAAICGECVDICVDTIAEDLEQEGRLVSEAEGSRVTSTTAPIACAICSTIAPAEDCVPVEDRGALCPGCVAAIRIALGDVESGVR